MEAAVLHELKTPLQVEEVELNSPQVGEVRVEVRTAAGRETPSASASEFLELFYPIHYTLGLTLEDALRSRQLLTRKQSAILWLLRGQGGPAYYMQRKDIERLLQPWFAVKGPALTKTLHALARPPLSLVRMVEDPHSKREKQVYLTAKGKHCLAMMVEDGQHFLQEISNYLSPGDMCSGLHFLQQVIGALERRHAARAVGKAQGERRSGGRQGVGARERSLHAAKGFSRVEESYNAIAGENAQATVYAISG